MKKINVSLVTLAIIIIGATYFNVIAQAAQVTRINANSGLIVIDGNKADGFVMGATVCFYSTSGEEITCGTVQQTSESYVTVRVNNRKAKHIRNGMEAILSGKIKDCVDDSECGDDGDCVNGKCIRSKEKKGCVDDSECGDDRDCVNGKCIRSKEKKGCVDDSECGDDGVCVNGKCINAKEKKGCVDDSECGDGGVCINGKCISR